ncbi:hypothetical protein ACLB0R_10915 [Sphingomonas sp. GlSt437]|uniref:hypothetical protein n=1 Tax=Sphingomonas sp. GlSt437 TaxID=3389970 RepID=UPI003A874A5C
MIQYEMPGVKTPLYRVRVRRLAGFALAAYPIGFALFLAGGEARPPAPLTIAGAITMFVAFFAALLVIPTGVQRIAAGVEQGLDEFQLAARLKAQSSAYRWFSGWVFVMAAYANVAAAFGWTMSTQSAAFSAILFWILTYSTVLPAWFLARALPDAAEDDD